MRVEASQPRTGRTKPDQLRTRVNLALLGVFIVFASLWAGLLWYRFSETVEAGERRAENLALILSDHLKRTIEATDAALVQLTLHGQRTGPSTATPEMWTPVLQAAHAGVQGIGSISVTDRDGRIVASTIPQIVGEPRRDMFVFQHLAADPQAGLVADTPFRSLRNQILIPLGRALAGPDGKFAGTIVATLEPERLREFYRSVDVGPHGVVTVLHPEGIVLFREPSTSDPIGEPAQRHPVYLAQQARPGAGMLRGALAPGGPSYISAYRTLAFPPLVIAVSVSEDDILGSWRHVSMLAIGLTIALGIALLLAGLLIAHEIRKRSATSDRLVEADAALRASQQRFQAIMDHAPVLVAEKDRDGRYVFVNRAFEKRHGVKAADILGKSAYDLFPAEQADLHVALDEEVVAAKAPVQREITMTTPAGQRTMLFIKFPHLDAHGNISGVGAIGADVTDLKQAEVQLVHAQKMEAIGQLTGGVAHDFNNLLTAILLNTDVLADRMSDDRLRPLAEATRTAAERGADLTKRLLAFGRRQTLEPRPTDVNALVTGMEHLMRRTLGEHIAITIQAAANLWPARVDPGQLESAVVNLAVNARDAMPQGGSITIETANVELDESYAGMNPDVKPGEYVMIAVSDTGSGMAADIVARAFEPFFTTKDVGKGTGLGLSMVYGFVKQSGGHARIYSEPGVGTVVRLYLPRSDVPAETAGVRPKAASELPTGGETILLVEDDPMVRGHTETQLAALGYRVISAENASEALDRVRNGTMPDLLFTDIVMPGPMNGRQLAERLRERWPGLKVLYTSGFSHGMLDAPLGGTVAAKHLLGKPFRRRDLAAKVREVLDEPEAA
jgi:PAS domain S-box-containing protein